MVSAQEPVGSPFGYRSTAMEVAQEIDLAGRHVVVTGGYSGIGTETVRALAAAGVDRVMLQLLLHDDLDQIALIGELS